MKYTIFACPKCGDDSIHRNATVAWDILHGFWEHDDVQDSFVCSACGAEFRSPTEIVVSELFGDTCRTAVPYTTLVLRPVRFVGDAVETCEPDGAQGWRVYWRRKGGCAQDDMYLVAKRTREDAEWWARRNVFSVAAGGGALVVETT